MPEPQKASPAEADLGQWALAQMKAAQLSKDERLNARCLDCPGPDAPGGCADRGPVKHDGKDWQICPRGMLRSLWWQGVVELRAASLVSPLHRFPDNFAARVVEGLIELRVADMKQAEEKAKDQAAKPPGGPEFSGRTSAREV